MHMADRHIRKLTSRKKRLAEQLPSPDAVLRGTLIKRFRKCGKPHCRCATGEPHGPNYYLLIKQRDGSTVTVPVLPDDRATVRAYVANHRKLKKLVEEIAKINTELLRKKRLKKT